MAALIHSVKRHNASSYIVKRIVPSIRYLDETDNAASNISRPKCIQLTCRQKLCHSWQISSNLAHDGDHSER